MSLAGFSIATNSFVVGAIDSARTTEIFLTRVSAHPPRIRMHTRLAMHHGVEESRASLSSSRVYRQPGRSCSLLNFSRCFRSHFRDKSRGDNACRVLSPRARAIGTRSFPRRGKSFPGRCARAAESLAEFFIAHELPLRFAGTGGESARRSSGRESKRPPTSRNTVSVIIETQRRAYIVCDISPG